MGLRKVGRWRAADQRSAMDAASSVGAPLRNSIRAAGVASTLKKKQKQNNSALIYWSIAVILFNLGWLISFSISSIIWATPLFSRVLLGFTGFYRVLLSFTRFQWVLLGFTRFNWVLLEFSTFLPSFTRFLQVFTRFNKVLLDFTGFY